MSTKYTTAKKRYAIVGTAASWSKTPWTDSDLYIASLNDAYRLKGFVRADEWYDTHPLDHFFHAPEGEQVYAHQVPSGYYVRPSDHLEWLAKQPIPVWLNPDYLTQYPDAANWPSARPLPWADIEAAFGRYFKSGPALMMAHALLRGFTEIHIYGIHLATEQEYVEQRPNFEFLIGRVLGPGDIEISSTDGIRRYETQHGAIVLPEDSPLLRADYVYSLQPRTRVNLEPLKWDLHRFQVKRERAVTQLKAAKLWTPTRQIKRDLERYDALIADTQDHMQRMQAANQIGG